MPRIKFTDRSLRAIKPPKTGQLTYWDETKPGFGLRIGRSGRRTFIAFYDLHGGQKRRKQRLSLGVYPTMALADAREAADKAMKLAARGEDPRAMQVEERKAEIFTELAREYIERHAKLHKRSWAKDRSILDNHFIPAFGQKRASAVRKADVIAVLDGIVAAGTPIAANRAFEVVRKVYNWALSRDLVEVSPCSGLGKPAPERKRERVLDDDEIRTFWRGLAGCAMHEGTRLALRMILTTAQRPGEVAGMAWSEIDEDAALWTIPAARMKGKRTQLVPLSPLAIELLGQAHELVARDRGEDQDDNETQASAFVFPSPWGEQDRPITGGALSRALRDCLAGATPQRRGIEARKPLPLQDLCPHDLRRTASTGMRAIGVPQFIVSLILAHAQRSVTGQHYDLYDALPERADALSRWANHLEAVIAGERPTVVPLRPARTATT